LVDAMPVRKPIHFLGSSRKDIRAMPEDVRDAFGSALLDAQYGDTYTVAFPRAVYVLHGTRT